MADIELVIKIDEEIYKKCKWKNNGVVGLEWWERAIANGTPISDTDNNLCSSCTNVECMFQSGIIRTKCAFYMPPHIEPDKEEQLKKLKAELAYAKFRCAYLQENQELLPMGKYGG